MTQTVVVTGASGYIGGQTVIKLLQQGYRVVAFDIRPLPANLIAFCKKFEDTFRFHHFPFESETALNLISVANQPTAIIHCAAQSLVGPSMTDPEVYYQNNVVNLKKLLDCMGARLKDCRLIFSSSASTYGNPIMTPIAEEDPQIPISPYGETKLIGEWMIKNYTRSYDMDHVCFRYFNATGADPDQLHGQRLGATHIIAQMLEQHRQGKTFTIYGNDYETADGTCVRDYTHVCDIVDAHIMAIDRSLVPSDCYNLGTGQGFSNLEVYNTACQVVGKEIAMEYGPRRPGDPAVLTAMSDKFNKITGWKPNYGLEQIVQHAWKWYERV